MIVGVLQVLLVLRVFLTLLDANPTQPLVRGLHVLSQPFVTPFVAWFASPRPTVLGGPIEFPAIAALLALTIVEVLVLGALSRLLARRSGA